MALQDGKARRVLHHLYQIEGTIKTITGLHIGGAVSTIEIGGIDQPVVRDPLTNFPYIPGSSLKGKLRALVERIATKNGEALTANRESDNVFRHECGDFGEAVTCPLCRVFGSTGEGSEEANHPSKIVVRDGLLTEKSQEKLMEDNLLILEAKMENTLDRLTSAAMPRTIERVPAGAEFHLGIIYRVEVFDPDGKRGIEIDESEVKDDLSHVFKALHLIEQDGIGGHISRGYGQVEFHISQFGKYSPTGELIEELRGTTPLECRETIESA